MANPTMTLISSNTVGSGGVFSVTFSSIPATYTDLKILMSVRDTGSGTNFNLTFNGNGSGYNTIRLYGNGSSTFSDSFSAQAAAYIGWDTLSTYTANTFSNIEFYIPNYTSSNYKSISNDGVSENNATTATQGLHAALWQNTAAITSLSISSGGTNNAQYSTFYLYGIKNS